MSCGSELHVCIDFTSNTNSEVKDVTVWGAHLRSREKDFPFFTSDALVLKSEIKRYRFWQMLGSYSCPLSLSAGCGCGQWRRQLVLLLGGISSAPSTATINVSATVICNGKSKADWGLSSSLGWRGWRTEGWQALSSPSVTASLLFTLYTTVVQVQWQANSRIVNDNTYFLPFIFIKTTWIIVVLTDPYNINRQLGSPLLNRGDDCGEEELSYNRKSVLSSRRVVWLFKFNWPLV